MGRMFVSLGGGFRFAACIAVAGALFAATSSPAAAARNEARWYQQNYCMVKAYKALGKDDYEVYDQAARKSRAKLIRAGVPERDIQELETFISRTIRHTKANHMAYQGPRICMQWYST